MSETVKMEEGKTTNVTGEKRKREVTEEAHKILEEHWKYRIEEYLDILDDFTKEYKEDSESYTKYNELCQQFPNLPKPGPNKRGRVKKPLLELNSDGNMVYKVTIDSTTSVSVEVPVKLEFGVPRILS